MEQGIEARISESGCEGDEHDRFQSRGKRTIRGVMLTCAQMKTIVAALCSLPLAGLAAESPAPQFDTHAAERFARLALACVHKEYPNHISHTLNSDADVAPPRKLTPAFCGCYDWHSSVHGHWLLARLARTFPDADFAPEARAALQRSLTEKNIAQEVAYLKPYGMRLRVFGGGTRVATA